MTNNYSASTTSDEFRPTSMQCAADQLLPCTY